MRAADMGVDGAPAGPNIYVTNEGGTGGDALIVLTPNASGAPTLVRTVIDGIHSPQVVAVDANGNVYVGNANTGGTTGTVTEYLASNPNTVCGQLNGINNPTVLKSQNGMLWVGTKGDSSLTEYFPPCIGTNSNVTKACGCAGHVASAFQHVGIIVNPQAVAFQGNGMVTLADPGYTYGGAITTWDYSNCSGQCQYRTITASIQNPQAIVYDANNVLWVANYGGDNVTAYAPSQNTLDTALAANPVADANTTNPNALALEGTGQNHILVQNAGSNKIERIDVTNGTITGTYGGRDQSGPYFGGASGIVVLPWPGQPGVFYFVAIGQGHITTSNNQMYGIDCGSACDNGAYGHGFSPYTTGVGTPTAIVADPT